jgi:hypothetical protein
MFSKDGGPSGNHGILAKHHPCQCKRNRYNYVFLYFCCAEDRYLKASDCQKKAFPSPDIFIQSKSISDILLSPQCHIRPQYHYPTHIPSLIPLNCHPLLSTLSCHTPMQTATGNTQYPASPRPLPSHPLPSHAEDSQPVNLSSPTPRLSQPNRVFEDMIFSPPDDSQPVQCPFPEGEYWLEVSINSTTPCAEGRNSRVTVQGSTMRINTMCHGMQTVSE